MFILVLFYFYVVISPTKCDKHFLISFEKKMKIQQKYILHTIMKETTTDTI